MTEMSEQAKAARREYLRRYRAEHREEVNRKNREYQRRYRAEHRENREYQRRYRAEHREELNRKRREHYHANKERDAARQAEYWERRAIREAEYREPDKRAALLATAMRELFAFRRKYQQLDELADIFAAIDAKEAET